MAFTRPSLTQLIDRIGTDLKTRLGLVGGVLRRSVMGILARVYAAAVHSLYGYLDNIARQSHPLTAEGRFLDRWASLWKVVRKGAIQAQGRVVFNGENGSEISQGTVLQRADGLEYRTTQSVIINLNFAKVPVIALDAGVQSNSDAGAVLTLISPIEGVQAMATIEAGGIEGGTDVETDTRLRARLLARIQFPSQGGTKEDYRQWALSVPNVTRAFVFENYLGGGTVGVSFVTDNLNSLIPDTEKINEVKKVIEVRRPLLVDVSVFAPVEVVVNLTIQLNPNQQEVQDAVRNELVDLFRRESAPNQSILLSRINEAISIAAGERDHTLVFPNTHINLSENEIATLGTITWE